MASTKRNNIKLKKTTVNFPKKPFIRQQLDDKSIINYDKTKGAELRYEAVDSLIELTVPFNITSTTINYTLKAIYTNDNGEDAVYATYKYSHIVYLQSNMTTEDRIVNGTINKNGVTINYKITQKAPVCALYTAGDGIKITPNETDGTYKISVNPSNDGVLTFNDKHELVIDYGRLIRAINGFVNGNSDDAREYFYWFDGNLNDDDDELVQFDENKQAIINQ
jgi:hypothetical protein